MEEVRRRIVSGADDAELTGLARELERALKIRTGYKPFLQNVRDSAAFDVLATARSLIATVPPKEVKQNIALAAIHSAIRFLAPSPISPGASLGGIVNSTKIGRGRSVRVSYNGMISRKNLACTLLAPELIQPHQQSCTQQFWDTVQNTCGPMQILLEVLCITMAFVEWLFCLP